MEDSTVYIVKKRTGVISCNNIRCLWGSSHRFDMNVFVQPICISMSSRYVRVCAADMYQYVQLICTCLFSRYVSVCSVDMYVFVQPIYISMFS